MLNFKNKLEREAFVNNYKDWTDSKGKKLGVWKTVPELGLVFYRYEFANGAVLVVTEYQEYRTIYQGYKATGKGYVTKHKLCLMLPEIDGYTDTSSTSGAVYHKTYTLDGCSIGTVIDYLTKNKLAI